MILITGGAGYIGSHVNKELHKEGYDTVVLDNLNNGYSDAVKWGKFVQGDLADINELDSIFKKYDIEGVMHFAGFISVGESVEFPAKYYKNNYKNTLGLLKVMNRNSVNKFIFSSTAAVYGNPKKIPITENHPLNPINPYGKSKLMVELALERQLKLNSDFKYSALRYFNASGADIDGEIGERHNPETHLIPLVLEVASGKRDSISVFGEDYDTSDGTCIRDYIHVTDLAQAHIKAFEYLNLDESENRDLNTNSNINLNRNSNINSDISLSTNSNINSDISLSTNSNENSNENNSNVFNLGNGNGFSVKEVIDVCEDVTGTDIKREILGRRDGDPAILIADSKKAKDILKWSPEFADLEKIVKTAWNWHKKQD